MKMNQKNYFSSTTKRKYKITVHLIKSKLLNSICFIKFFQCHLVKQRCITFYKVFFMYILLNEISLKMFECHLQNY